MNKKFVATVLGAVIALSPLSIMAGTVHPKNSSGLYYVDYWPGSTECVVEAENCTTASQGAVVEADGVLLGSNGSAMWDVYLPYSSRSVTINYSGGGDITLATRDNTYNTITLPQGTNASYTLEFGTNLNSPNQYRNYNYEEMNGYLLEYVEHRGNNEITVTSSEGAEVKIHSFSFEKEKTPVPRGLTGETEQVYIDGQPMYDRVEDEEGNITTVPRMRPKYRTSARKLNVSDYTIKSLNTVLLHEDANILVANGGRRYIDNNDTSLKPYNINGSMYLPINTLAKALGYYCEDVPEKGYALMRSETHEVSLVGGVCTVTEGLGEAKNAPKNVFAYHKGKTLAAVRYFGELAGMTVGYKDGLVAIDNKYTVSDILDGITTYSGETETFNAYANRKFDGFKSEAVEGETYYVATNGRYDNKGTKLSPWNIKKAMSSAKAGDTIVFLEGVYRETLKPENNGTPSAPITFKAEEGAEVVLSAVDVLGTPVRDTDYPMLNVYKISMEKTMGDGRDQIFIDGELQTEARYPDGPGHITADDRLSNAWGVRGDIFKRMTKLEAKPDNYKVLQEYEGVDYTTFVSDTLLDQDENYWVGGTYVGQFNNAYALVTGKIVASDKGSLTIGEKRNQRWWWNSWVNQESVTNSGNNMWNYGMIVGHINAMNLPGEWVRTTDAKGENGTLRIVLQEGTDPETVQLEAKARQLVVDLTDREYINIEGIKTIGGGVTMDESEMCMLNNMDMKYIGHYTVTADSRNGYIDFPTDENGFIKDSNGMIYDNTQKGAPQRGEVGIYLGGSDNIVVNSKIDHSAGAALYITGLYSYIENNIMSNCGYMGSYVSGIHIDTLPWETYSAPRGGYAIYNNTVYNTGRASIDFCRNEYKANDHANISFLPSEIAYNDFHDAGLTALDTGVVYANGVVVATDNKATEVHHNYIYKTTTSPDRNHFDMALYWDGNAMGFDSYSNLLFDVGGEPFMSQYDCLQSAMGSEAWARLWNNQRIGHIDVADPDGDVADQLEEEYFSEGKSFLAGSDLTRNIPYLKNYNRVTGAEARSFYSAKDATLGEGVELNEGDGYASYTGDGQTITFDNVVFSEGTNEMVISYRCDSNRTFDELHITVEDLESGATETYKQTLFAQDPPTLDDVCTYRFMMNSARGNKRVTFKVNKYYSVSLGGFNLYSRRAEYQTDDFTHFAYISNYTDGKIESIAHIRRKTNLMFGNPTAPGVDQTYGGNILRFAKQAITGDSEYFIMAAGSRDRYRKQQVKVYLCPPADEYTDPSGEPVATYTVLNKTFYDFEPLIVPVSDVKAGVYDIYVEFCNNPDGTGTSNVHYFGFLKEGADVSGYSTEARCPGGMYDAELSDVDENDPPIALALSRGSITPEAPPKKAINVKTGTKLVYTDIDTTTDCDRVRLAYYAKGSENVGQSVNISVADKDGNIIATAVEGITTTECADGVFNEVTVNLNTVVPALRSRYMEGYRIIVELTGESADQICQIGWIRLEN